MSKKRIFRGLSAITIAVTAIVICLTLALNVLFQSRVHEYLQTSGRVTMSDDPVTQYYKSEYNSSSEMVEAKLAYIQDSVGEGYERSNGHKNLKSRIKVA